MEEESVTIRKENFEHTIKEYLRIHGYHLATQCPNDWRQLPWTAWLKIFLFIFALMGIFIGMFISTFDNEQNRIEYLEKELIKRGWIPPAPTEKDKAVMELVH